MSSEPSEPSVHERAARAIAEEIAFGNGGYTSTEIASMIDTILALIYGPAPQRAGEGAGQMYAKAIPYVEAVIEQLESEVELEYGHTAAQQAISQQIEEAKKFLSELRNLPERIN